MTDYALRVLIYVAQHPERLCTISEIAERYEISEAHLMKVTHRLSIGGWLETVRGRGGGMRLARQPQDISLGDVVRGIDLDRTDCWSGPGGHQRAHHMCCAPILTKAFTPNDSQEVFHAFSQALPKTDGELPKTVSWGQNGGGVALLSVFSMNIKTTY